MQLLFLFAPSNNKWFVNWILIQSTLCPHQACKAQSHVAVQAEDRVEIHIGIPKLVMTDMSYVRRVLWYMRIYFFFFRRSFHDGPMSFEYMPGWILLNASLQGGSKTSISCCCASRRGWRGRWTKDDAQRNCVDPACNTHGVPFCK